MHPILIRFGETGGGLPTYGVAMALGFLTAILLGSRLAERQGISVNRMLDLFFWILAASLLGSRLVYVAVNAGDFVRVCAGPAAGVDGRGAGQLIYDCTRALHIWEGGFVYFGGLACSVAVSVWYTRRHGMDFFRVADLAVPLIALGHFFGRLGCFAAGCCYGKPTSSALGAVFPPGSLAHLELVRDHLIPLTAAGTPPLHPTQLYEALAELLIFGALLLWSSRKRYHGQLLVLYMLAYPLARAVIELFRADPSRGYLVQLSTPALNALLGLPPGSASLISTSQAFALVSVAGALLLGRWLRRRVVNM